MKIAVVGLGKLGAPMAAELADRGWNVVGVDLNPDTVAKMSRYEAPVDEPQLQELLNHADNQKRLHCTSDFTAVSDADIVFIIVPTPSDDSGAYSNSSVLAATIMVGEQLDRNRYHLVVIVSTVMPTSCNGVLRAELEHASGRKLGLELGLCYNPEFIALGSVIYDMRHPDLILIGESDTFAGDVLHDFYDSMRRYVNGAVVRMSLSNAELAKIAINSFITTKISLANTIGLMCERMPTGDATAVLNAVGMDSRIGSKYLKAGPSFGGPCFPRDNRALARFANQVGVMAPIQRATDEVNTSVMSRLAYAVGRECASLKTTVGVFGISYKDNTNVTEDSPSLKLIDELLEMGVTVHAWDRNVRRLPEHERAIYFHSLQDDVDLKSMFQISKVIVVMSRDKSLRSITPPVGSVVFDLWNVYEGLEFSGVTIRRAGKCAV